MHVRSSLRRSHARYHWCLLDSNTFTVADKNYKMNLFLELLPSARLNMNGIFADLGHV
jgi:hypothetical protein